MRHLLRGRAAKAAAAGLAAVGLFAGGVAWAGDSAPVITMTGHGLVLTKVATYTENWKSLTLNMWEDVGGASITITVPGGSERLVTARFNAETFCSAVGVETWCSMRIMAHKAGASGSVQLHPRSGSDFAIDSPGGENWEGNSITRSLRLGSGTWTVFAQGMTIASDGQLILDDWHFEVDVYTAS